MDTKMHVTVVLAVFCIAGAVGDWKNLHVKYALWDGFYSMPLTLKEATRGNYVYMGTDNDLNVALYSYPNDPRVSIMFDSYGNIAGIRTCYIKSDVPKRAEANDVPFNYNFNNLTMYQSGNYWGTDLWYTSTLFASPDVLRAGGRNDTGGLVADDIYVKLNGNWTKLPKDECDAIGQGFTKQACFLGMGMHYFYGMTPEVNCSDLQGVFLLYESKELIGLGIIPFGSFTHLDRKWFEDPPSSVVKKIVPNRPDCLVDWVNNYGTTSLHIFFKKYPRLTFCVWPWQKSNNCNN